MDSFHCFFEMLANLNFSNQGWLELTFCVPRVRRDFSVFWTLDWDKTCGNDLVSLFPSKWLQNWHFVFDHGWLFELQGLQHLFQCSRAHITMRLLAMDLSHCFLSNNCKLTFFPQLTFWGAQSPRGWLSLTTLIEVIPRCWKDFDMVFMILTLFCKFEFLSMRLETKNLDFQISEVKCSRNWAFLAVMLLHKKILECSRKSVSRFSEIFGATYFRMSYTHWFFLEYFHTLEGYGIFVTKACHRHTNFSKIFSYAERLPNFYHDKCVACACNFSNYFFGAGRLPNFLYDFYQMNSPKLVFFIHPHSISMWNSAKMVSFTPKKKKSIIYLHISSFIQFNIFNI